MAKRGDVRIREKEGFKCPSVWRAPCYLRAKNLGLHARDTNLPIVRRRFLCFVSLSPTLHVRLVVASPEFTFNANWGAQSEWKMKRYTAEFREWAMRQMMPPLNRGVIEMSGATGVTTVTLHTWRRHARNLHNSGEYMPGNGKTSDQWSSADKFRVVLETAQLSDTECERNPLVHKSRKSLTVLSSATTRTSDPQ